MTALVDVASDQSMGTSRASSDSFRDRSRFVPRMIGPKTFDKICMVLAEVLGTATLMFFGCMANVPMAGLPLGINPPITFGLTVMMIIQMFGHISVAILNPAVAIAAVVYDLISIKMAFLYVVAETVGAVLGYGLLQYLSPEDIFSTPNGVCMTLPHEGISLAQAFFIEFFLTCALISMICGVWDPRNRENLDSAPLRIGLAIIGLSIAGGPYTDASMNPVRSLAPALWNWNWTHHWIYWVAPLAAGLIASLFYKVIFWRRNPKDEEAKLPLAAAIEQKTEL